MKKRVNFRIRVQPYEGSKEYLLLRYIESHEKKPLVVMKALFAYYYPLAYKEKERNPRLVKDAAKEAISDIIQQMSEIATSCGLDDNQVKAMFVANFGELYQSGMPKPDSEETPKKEIGILDFDPSLIDLSNYRYDNDN